MSLFNKLRISSTPILSDPVPLIHCVQEDAILETHASEEEIADPLYVEPCWPSLVHLNAQLQPFPFAPSPLWVQEKSMGKLYSSLDLYHHNPVAEKSCPAVGFVYQEEGTAFFQNQPIPIFFKGNQFRSYHFSLNKYLYIKPFAHQQQAERGNILQQLFLNSKGQWVPEIDSPPYRPLYPFGGNYISGLPLEFMNLLYFHISHYQEKTVFFTETEQSRFESILNPEKTTFKVMQPVTTEESCSVAEALRAGFSHVFLFDVQNQQQKYVSYGFESIIPSQNYYKIYYKMEKQ